MRCVPQPRWNNAASGLPGHHQRDNSFLRTSSPKKSIGHLLALAVKFLTKSPKNKHQGE
jgi:hypothetical protein